MNITFFCLFALAQFSGLDSESYEERESTTNSLIEQTCKGDKSLVQKIEDELKVCSLEAKFRLKHVLDVYYNPAPNLPIWALTEKLRFNGGVDWAAIYYKQEYQKDKEELPEAIYGEEYVLPLIYTKRIDSIMATRAFVRDYLVMGDRPSLVKELQVCQDLWNEEQSLRELKFSGYGSHFIKNPQKIEDRVKYLRDANSHEDLAWESLLRLED